jgi:hypothetical protein
VDPPVSLHHLSESSQKSCSVRWTVNKESASTNYMNNKISFYHRLFFLLKSNERTQFTSCMPNQLHDNNPKYYLAETQT